MKFISFIASTVLIVLISQQSTMGLPLNDTMVDQDCSEGFKWFEGHCEPIKSEVFENKIELTSFHPESKTIHVDEPVTIVIDSTKQSGHCEEGWKHGKNGVCEKILIQDTTEANYETTFETVTKSAEVDMPRGCPKGTQADYDGTCHEIKSMNNTKTIIDPKNLLEQDGACPRNFKKIDGRCLYVEHEEDSKGDQDASSSFKIDSNDRRPEINNSEYPFVPVLSGNQCPNGTDYVENGLCQVRAHSSNAKLWSTVDTKCSINYELINGKCSPKTVEIHDLSEHTSAMNPIVETHFKDQSETTSVPF